MSPCLPIAVSAVGAADRLESPDLSAPGTSLELLNSLCSSPDPPRALSVDVPPFALDVPRRDGI